MSGVFAYMTGGEEGVCVWGGGGGGRGVKMFCQRESELALCVGGSGSIPLLP